MAKFKFIRKLIKFVSVKSAKDKRDKLEVIEDKKKDKGASVEVTWRF